jgi:hypothetical protein
MAYKFAMGETVLSGTLTQVSGTVGLETEGILSASQDISTGVLNIVSLGKGFNAASKAITNINVDSGAIDGATIGANSAAAGTFLAIKGTTLSGSSTLNVDGTAQFNGAVSVKTGVAFNSDTVNIDGGAIDGTIIGANSAAAGTFAAIVGTTITGSGAATLTSLHCDSVNIDGGNIDGTIIGAASVAAGSFAAIVGTSADINGVGDFSDTLTLSKGSGNGLVVTADCDLNGDVDIAGDLMLGGADGALRFTNAGENSIKVPDDQVSALIIEEANNPYLTIDSTNSKEKVQISKKLSLSSSTAGPQILEFDGLNAIQIAGGNLGMESTGDIELLANGGSNQVQVIGALSASGELITDSNIKFMAISADTAFDIASDMLYFRDANDSGRLKAMSNSSYLTDIAGAGLSVSGNQLAVQGSSVNVATNGAMMAEGYNYVADISSAITLGLPSSPAVGDVVTVKLQGVTGAGQVTVSSSVGAHRIDGETTVILSSDHGAITFFYAVANKWLIV